MCLSCFVWVSHVERAETEGVWEHGAVEDLIASFLAEKFASFIESEGSLPCSQNPLTCPCSEPDESTHTHTHTHTHTDTHTHTHTHTRTLFVWDEFERYPPICVEVLFFPSGFLCSYLGSLARYMLHPSHPSWFNRINNIWWRIKIMNLIMQFSRNSCYAFLFSFIHQWFYILLLGPALFFSSVIIFTQMVGLLGLVISPS
jgi:hypothetical protein